MKPDWDKLSSTYADSKTVVIAHVDCTADGKSLCEKHGIQGYPTIKYGEPENLRDYSTYVTNGKRDLASLEKFAAEHLDTTCGPDNLDLCDETDKKFIAKFKKWDIDELDMAIEEEEVNIKNIEAAGKKVVDGLEKELQSLRATFEKERKKKDSSVENTKKETGYMKAVKASRTPKADEKGGDEKKEEL